MNHYLISLPDGSKRLHHGETEPADAETLWLTVRGKRLFHCPRRAVKRISEAEGAEWLKERKQ